MKVETKNGLPEERAVAKTVRELVEKYDIPQFTDRVLVEHGVRPHSHPVLTLSTGTKDPLALLDKVVHEQLHWWAQDHPRYDECIAYLKKHYKDNGEHNKSGTYPNSFWEHIIVCFNTRKVLISMLSREEVEHVYNEWQAYPKTEVMIKEKYDHIEQELKQFDMVYSTT